MGVHLNQLHPLVTSMVAPEVEQSCLIVVAGTGGLSKVDSQVTVLVTWKHADGTCGQIVRVAPGRRHPATYSYRRATSGFGLRRIT